MKQSLSLLGFGLFLTAFLTSCGGIKKESATDDIPKVEASGLDLAGTPNNFAGTWVGQCRSRSGTDSAKDCTMQLQINQDPANLSLQTSVVANGSTTTSGTVSYQIKGNQIISNDVQVGLIGVSAFRIPTASNQVTFKMDSDTSARLGIVSSDLSGQHAIYAELRR